MELESYRSFEALTGQSAAHLEQLPAELDGRTDPEEPLYLHPEAISALVELRLVALAEQIDLRVVSGFRSFDRQRSIWNRKCAGELPLYSREGEVIKAAELAPQQLLETVSFWSALPGASRHHWGSDVDLIDFRPVSRGYRPELLPSEYSQGGAMERLGGWLDELCASAVLPFARPYDLDRGGVAPEPWHLSFQPLALELEKLLKPALFYPLLEQGTISLSQQLLEDFEGYWERWIASAFLSNRPSVT